MQHVLHEMRLTVDHNGEHMFMDETIAKVTKLAVDG